VLNKSYSSSTSTRRCKLGKLDKDLNIKSSKLRQEFIKTPTHASSTRKPTSDKTLSGTREHGDTCLVRRRVGALITKALVALSTIYT
jgi:hypothetical protein